MKKQLFLISIFLTGFISLFGQSKTIEALDVISTSGSTMVSEDIVISWTIGENIIDFYQTNASASTKPEEMPGVIEMENGTLLKVYPTLTTGMVTIKIRAEEPFLLQAELLDLKGSKLKMIQLDADEVELDLNSFKSGMYILRISDNKVIDHKFVKIVKH